MGEGRKGGWWGGCHVISTNFSQMNGLIVRSFTCGREDGWHNCGTLLALYVSAFVKALGLSHSILHHCSLHLRFALYTFHLYV